MKIKLIKPTKCAQDVHETTKYPRSCFKPKPELPIGTTLEVSDTWINFYGEYYRCILPKEMKDKGYTIPWYDIPIENAEKIISDDTENNKKILNKIIKNKK